MGERLEVLKCLNFLHLGTEMGRKGVLTFSPGQWIFLLPVICMKLEVRSFSES